MVSKKYHLNLDYLRKIDYTNDEISENKLMKDLYFLVCGENQLDKVLEKSDNLMKEVIEEAKQIAAINQMDLYLTEEEMIENDKKHFIEVGRKEEKHEMIINMYNKNIDLHDIADISNLSVKEVEKIIKQNKKDFDN